jgi:hypothetical protein
MSASRIHPAKANYRHGGAEGRTAFRSFHAGFALRWFTRERH